MSVARPLLHIQSVFESIYSEKKPLTFHNILPRRTVRRKITVQKHMQRCNRYPLTPIVCLLAPRFLKLPNISGPRIQENRNEEKVDKTTHFLYIVKVLIIPLTQ